MEGDGVENRGEYPSQVGRPDRIKFLIGPISRSKPDIMDSGVGPCKGKRRVPPLSFQEDLTVSYNFRFKTNLPKSGPVKRKDDQHCGELEDNRRNDRPISAMECLSKTPTILPA